MKYFEYRKSSGIFFTPDSLVSFMIDLLDDRLLYGKDLKVLEPACGLCQFLLGLKRKRPELYDRFSKRIGVEINEDMVNSVRDLKVLGIDVINTDFLLWETDELFDLILGNPPYGIPSPSDHYTIKVNYDTKKKYRNLYETWYGKYNVYGAFIEKSIKLLRENGQLIFIVPATFMILDEFKKLRIFLSSHGRTEIIYMGNEIFKPEADITTVILKFVKNLHEKGNLVLYDHEDGKLEAIYQTNSWRGEMITFSSEFTRKLEDTCSFRLDSIYTIRISPRTSEIRSNMYVIESESPPDGEGFLPILNGKNLKVGRIVYEPLSGYWIHRSKKTMLRKFFDEPRIVVGLGFRKNRRIGCAYDVKAYPWMGDVYHLLRKRTLTNMNFDLTEEEVVEFLSSEIMSRYVREVFRDITYHFSIAQLRILPLPTKNELLKLREIFLCQETGRKI